jgi:hypothetical protein
MKGREDMAKALRGTGLVASASSVARSLRAVWILRLALGFTVLLGATLFFLSGSWDIQWHIFIGRDRTLIPPHLVMLGGVTLSGMAGLASVLIETLWARRNPLIASNSRRFADAFSGSLGAYLAGFGALDAAVGFPLDSYWHALYGIDAAIWAPFHIMFIVGTAIAALGAAYMLISAAHLAASKNALGSARVGYLGAAIALAITMNVFTLLLFNAYGMGDLGGIGDFGGRGTIHLGILVINVFTLLAALLGTWTFVVAAHALSWRWSATSVAALSLLFVGIVALVVPPATDLLAHAEHLTYRRPGFYSATIPWHWPALFIVAALLTDYLTRLARHHGWSSRRYILTVAISALIGFLPVPFIFPLYPLYLAGNIGRAGSIVTLLLGLLGAGVGSWLGRNTGESMDSLER